MSPDQDESISSSIDIFLKGIYSYYDHVVVERGDSDGVWDVTVKCPCSIHDVTINIVNEEADD